MNSDRRNIGLLPETADLAAFKASAIKPQESDYSVPKLKIQFK